MSTPDSDPFLDLRNREEQKWKDIQAGKLPHPLQQLDMTKSKEALAKEVFELQQTLARQTAIIEELKEAKIVLEGKLVDAINRRVPPVKAPKEKKKGV